MGQIRVVPPDAADRILDFYLEYPNKNILPRPAEIEAAIRRGLGLEIIIDGEVVAATQVFVVAPSCEPPLLELGASRIADHWRGKGLYKYVIGGRLALIAKSFGGRGARALQRLKIVTAVDPGNSDARPGIEKSGFLQYDDVQPELLTGCAQCLKRAAALAEARSCCCNFYALPHERFLADIRDFASQEKIVLTSGMGGSPVHIENQILTKADRLELSWLLR